MSYCIVLSTSGSQEEADKIAGILLENGLAACVQMAPITSLYRWKGKIERANEMRLLIKTTDANYRQVESTIRENHSYDTPQIVKLPINDGLPEYLDWISDSTNLYREILA